MPAPGPDDETVMCCYDATMECVRGGCKRIAELERERDEARALARCYRNAFLRQHEESEERPLPLPWE